MKNFIDTCQKKQIKVTPQRLAVYKAIYKETSHPSAKYVYEKVKKDLPNISFDTVYRTLNQFSQLGLLRIVEHNSLTRRYDPNINNHPHFVCKSCQNIYDLNLDLIDNNIKKINDKNIYKITDKELLIKGICQKCK